jgi:micrococcal nuclease
MLIGDFPVTPPLSRQGQTWWQRIQNPAIRQMCLLPAAILCVAAHPAPAAESLAGPLPATVVRVVDGDTLDVKVRIWLGQDLETRIRLDGIDAPELHGRCDAERRLADAARALLAREAASGAAVRLRDVRNGKFAGRVLARVETAAGQDLGQALLNAGLARPYGGGRRSPWCPGANS